MTKPLTERQQRALDLAKETINAAAQKLIRELEAAPFRLEASDEFRADFHLACVGEARGHCFGQPLRMDYPLYFYASIKDDALRLERRASLSRPASNSEAK